MFGLVVMIASMLVRNWIDATCEGWGEGSKMTWSMDEQLERRYTSLRAGLRVRTCQIKEDVYARAYILALKAEACLAKGTMIFLAILPLYHKMTEYPVRLSHFDPSVTRKML